MMTTESWEYEESMANSVVIERLQKGLKSIDKDAEGMRFYHAGKHTISLFGPQNAGKSALVNYLLGAYVRQSAQAKVDTQFTIIETVSQDEFYNYVKESDYDKSDVIQKWPWPRPIIGGGTDGGRYGHLYVHLDATRCRFRYQHSDILSGEVGKDVVGKNQLGCVLVNEDHLPPDALARKLIIIDTRGFDKDDKADDVETCECLQAKQLYAHFFQKSSKSYVLFPVPIDMITHKQALLFIQECRALSLGNTLIKEKKVAQKYRRIRFPRAKSDAKDLQTMWLDVRFIVTQCDRSDNIIATHIEFGKLLGTTRYDVSASYVKFIDLPEEQRGSNAAESDTTGFRVELERESRAERTQKSELEYMEDLAELVIDTAHRTNFVSRWKRSAVDFAEDVRMRKLRKTDARVRIGFDQSYVIAPVTSQSDGPGLAASSCANSGEVARPSGSQNDATQ